MNTFYRLQSIFREVFNDPSLRLTPEMSVATFPEWDSVATVHIVLATEAAFGLRFTTDEVAAIRSVVDILRLLEAYAVPRDTGALVRAAA